MDNYVETFDLYKIKQYEQKRFMMLNDHTRQRAHFKPLEQREKYKAGIDLIYEFYSKSFYHYINFNSACVTADLVFEIMPLADPEDASITRACGVYLTLPYNYASFISEQDHIYGTYLLDQIRDYGTLVPTLMAMRDFKNISDSFTGRCTEELTTVNLDNYNQNVTASYNTHRGIVFKISAGQAMPASPFVYKMKIQFPLFSVMEDADIFPIYNCSNPLRIVWKFVDPNSVIAYYQAKNQTVVKNEDEDDQMQTEDLEFLTVREIYFNNFDFTMDTYKVSNTALLDTEPYSWKSISYDYYGPISSSLKMNQYSNTGYLYRHDFLSRWKNLKNCLITFYDYTNVVNRLGDQGLSALIGMNQVFSEEDFGGRKNTVTWKFAQYSYPYQDNIQGIKDLWWETLQYFGVADDNGVENTRVLNYQTWLNKFGVLGFDFSTIPQVDEIISGLNTKQTVLSFELNAALNPYKDTTMGMKFFFGRNIMLILADGVIGKVE